MGRHGETGALRNDRRSLQVSMKELELAVSRIDHLFGVAWELSGKLGGRPCKSDKEFYGSHLFSGICLLGNAILRLLPPSKYYGSPRALHDDIWNLPAVAGSVRILSEYYYTFFDLAVESVNERESAFRFRLWKYSGLARRIEMLSKISSTDPAMKRIERAHSAAKSELEKDSIFQELSKDKRQNLLTGVKSSQFKWQEIVARRGLSLAFCELSYIELSQFVHANPFALEQLANFSPSNEDSFVLLTSPLRDFEIFLSLAVFDAVKLYAEIEIERPKWVFDLMYERVKFAEKFDPNMTE